MGRGCWILAIGTGKWRFEANGQSSNLLNGGSDGRAISHTIRRGWLKTALVSLTLKYQHQTRQMGHGCWSLEIGTGKWRFEANGQSSNHLMEAVMVDLSPTPSGEVG